MCRREEPDYHEYCIRCIVGTSVQYARYYINRADAEMLEEALRRLGNRKEKTLRSAIEAKLRKLKRIAAKQQGGGEVL